MTTIEEITTFETEQKLKLAILQFLRQFTEFMNLINGNGLDKLKPNAKKAKLSQSDNIGNRFLSNTEQNFANFNILDGIGSRNVSVFTHICCNILNSEKEFIETKVAVLDFILNIGKFQPQILSLLIGVHVDADENLSQVKSIAKSGTSSKAETKESGDIIALGYEHAQPKDSILLTTLTSNLAQASDLYANAPLLLHKVYELVYCILTNSTTQLALQNGFIFLLSDTKFWSLITYPLMMDLPTLPQSLSKILTNSLVDSHDLTNLESLPQIFSLQNDSEFLSDSHYYHETILSYCYCLLTHISSLKLITAERFGLIYQLESDYETVSGKAGGLGHENSKKMNDFFVKATNASRYLAWIKNYLHCQSSTTMIESLLYQCLSLGLGTATPYFIPHYNLNYLSRGSNDLLISEAIRIAISQESFPKGFNLVSKFGMYAIDTAKPNLVLKEHYYDTMVSISTDSSSNFNNSFKSLNYFDKLKSFISDLSNLNVLLSLSDTQYVLLNTFGKFLQFYIQPVVRYPSLTKSLTSESLISARYDLVSSRNRSTSRSLATPPHPSARAHISKAFDFHEVDQRTMSTGSTHSPGSLSPASGGSPSSPALGLYD
jgi:hypothetical protein